MKDFVWLPHQSFSLKEVKVGTRDLEARTKAEAMKECLLPMACFIQFSIICSVMALPMVDWAISIIRQ